MSNNFSRLARDVLGFVGMGYRGTCSRNCLEGRRAHVGGAFIIDVADVEGLGVTQVVSIPCGLVHPGSRPQQLVVDGAGVVQGDGRAVQLHRGRHAYRHDVAACQLLRILLLAWQHHGVPTVPARQKQDGLKLSGHLIAHSKPLNALHA